MLNIGVNKLGDAYVGDERKSLGIYAILTNRVHANTNFRFTSLGTRTLTAR
jgi:hypothetical protein